MADVKCGNGLLKVADSDNLCFQSLKILLAVASGDCCAVYAQVKIESPRDIVMPEVSR